LLLVSLTACAPKPAAHAPVAEAHDEDDGDRGDLAPDSQAVHIGIVTEPQRPCSPDDLHAPGRSVPVDQLACRAHWRAIEDILGDYRAAAAGMHDSNPPAQHVIAGDESGQLYAIETTGAAELARLATCDASIDWMKHRAWVVLYEAEDGRVEVGSLIDDAKAATLGLRTAGRGCGGAAPRWRHAFTVVVVPGGRTLALSQCRSEAPERHCTGFEK
jgi:hypothetical protein